MTKLARLTFTWALALTACNASKEKSETTQDAGDDARAGGHAQAAGSADAAIGPADGATATGDAGGPAPVTTLASFVYVGGYGSPDPYPVRTYSLDRTTGALTQQAATIDLGDSPTFIAPSFDHHFLYVANESGSNGGVTVAAVDGAGRLSKLKQQHASNGLVFTSLDPGGNYVLAASYNGGFVNVFPVQRDGTLQAAVDTEQFDPPAHPAPGVSSAQTHSVRVHPKGKWAYVPNKARNEVAQFGFDATSGKLTPLKPKMVTCGGGPRHIAFNSSGSFAFVVTELSTELVSYRVGDTGLLTEIDRKSALPSGITGDQGAHVLVHPNDKFVYASNRTDNSIAVFSLASAGELTQIQIAKTMGNAPRNFDIDSVGKFLIAANMGDGGMANGSLIVFEIGDNGWLTQRGALVTGIESPAAVAIVSNPSR